MNYESHTAENPRKILEKKFDHPEILSLNGENVEVYDIAPLNPKTKIPTVFGLGWSASTPIYKENMITFAERGRRVLSANTPHGIEAKPVNGQPEVEIRKAAAILEMLKKKNIEKTDAVAHSEAAIFVTLAASLRPEKFRNIILINPAGIIGKDKLRRLAFGFTKDLLKTVLQETKRERNSNTKPKNGFKEIIAPLLVLSKNPIQAIKSVFAIANSDIREVLADLKSKGIGISIVHGVRDEAFPIEKVTNLKEIGAFDVRKESPENVGAEKYVDGFYSVRGLHNEFILDAATYSKAAEIALRDLEIKQSGIK